MEITSAAQSGTNLDIGNGTMFADWVGNLPVSEFEFIERLIASSEISSQSGPSTPPYAPNMGSFDPAPSGHSRTAADVARCENSALYNPGGYIAHERQDVPTASVGTSVGTMKSLSYYQPSAHQNFSNGVQPMEDVFHDQSVPANGINSHGMVSGQTSSAFYIQPAQAYSATSDGGAFGQMNGNLAHQQDPNHTTVNAVPDVQPTQAYSVSASGATSGQMSSSSYTHHTHGRYSVTSHGVAPLQMDNSVVHQKAPNFVHATAKVVAKPTENQFSPEQHWSRSTSGSSRSREPNSVNSTPQSSRASTPAGSASTEICPVCEERATGKHYGIDCCDGCKSFFRRAIRGNREFKCDRFKKCDIRKSTLSRCRACRLKKCLDAGMNKNSVQTERDKLYRPRRGKASKTGDSETRSAIEAASLTSSATSSSTARSVASLEDVSYFLTSMGTTLHEWGTRIRGFSSFTMEDQNSLVNNHRGAHLLIEIAASSVNSYPSLMMGEGFIINRDQEAPTGHLGSIIHRNIMVPLIEVKPDKTELCLMKLFILYDNTLPGIVNQGLVMENQALVFLELEKHIRLEYPSQTTARLDRICSLIDGFTTTACELSRILARRPSNQGCR